MRAWAARLWGSLERVASGRWAAHTLFVVALAVYALVSVAWPVAPGRDLGTYLRASFELRSAEVVLPQALLMRAPLTGVVSEALLSAGPFVAEAAMAVLYAVSILCWFLVARRFGPAPGIVVAAALLLYPSYALLFHRLASDALYAAAFAVAALLTARAIERPSAGRSAALGAAVAGLVLVRPVSQVLILLAPLLLLCPGPWRLRVGRLAAFAVAAVLPLAGWAAHNAVRADDFTVARGGGHSVPLFRAFVVDRIVRPENGPASRELARAVAQDLLPQEPYRSYGIELDEFFSSGSARMHEDLIGLADRTWGWSDDYSHLQRVGREAVLSHPGDYARGVGRDIWRLLWWPLFLPLDRGEESAAPRTGYGPTVEVDRPLPRPSEGQPIPAARQSGWISTPDGRIREVWTSPTDHGIVFRDPEDRMHLDELERRLSELLTVFPDRDGNTELGNRLNQASRWFPRPVVWLVAGLVAVVLRRPRRVSIPLALVAAALLVMAGTALAVPATAEYSTPVAPAFILLAVVSLLGERSRHPRTAAP